MKTEYELKRKDLKEIADIARELFLKKSVSLTQADDRHFLCECYSTAFLSYVSRKKWIVEAGKIYET